MDAKRHLLVMEGIQDLIDGGNAHVLSGDGAPDSVFIRDIEFATGYVCSYVRQVSKQHVTDGERAEIAALLRQLSAGARITRVDVRAILRDPVQRREMCIRTIIATQAREGIETTYDQAAAAYDAVQKEKAAE